MGRVTTYPGRPFGIRELKVMYKGPPTNASLLVFLGKGWAASGHEDPATGNRLQQTWRSIRVPASDAVSEVIFRDIDLGPFPDLEAGGTYDVNVAIGPPRGQGQLLRDWYSHRWDDDWDDDVYVISPPTVKLVGDAEYY